MSQFGIPVALFVKVRGPAIRFHALDCGKKVAEEISAARRRMNPSLPLRSFAFSLIARFSPMSKPRSATCLGATARDSIFHRLSRHC